MDLGLLLELDPGAPSSSADLGACFDRALDQVCLADALGFSSAWFVEHHFRPDGSVGSSPELLVGALTRLTTSIQLGFGAVLAPAGTTPPVRIAEKIATADQLTGGRVAWATNLGSGTGRAVEGSQTGFGAPPSDASCEVWSDSIRAAVEMWRPGPFTWESPRLRFATPTDIVPKPLQHPHPAPWSAAVDEASAAFAGRAGMGLLAFPTLQPLAATAAAVRAYREAATNPEPLTGVVLERVAAAVTVVCTPGGDVPDDVMAALRRWYRVTAEMAVGWGYDALTPSAFPLLDAGLDAGDHDRDILALDSVVVGSARRCADRLAAYGDLGVDVVLCACDPGGLASEHALQSIELLGRDVLPRLRPAAIRA